MSQNTNQIWLPHNFKSCYCRFRPYLWKQLRRRGIMCAEAQENARQNLAMVWYENNHDEVPPQNWETLRQRIDRAVYLTEKQTRSIGTNLYEYDGLEANSSKEHDKEQQICQLFSQIQSLTPPQRLVLKLKHADYFYPNLDQGLAPLESDEAVWLIQRHSNRYIDQISAEFLHRWQGKQYKKRSKIPADVIAWLVGKPSATSVDSAYRQLKIRLAKILPTAA